MRLPTFACVAVLLCVAPAMGQVKKSTETDDFIRLLESNDGSDTDMVYQWYLGKRTIQENTNPQLLDVADRLMRRSRGRTAIFAVHQWAQLAIAQEQETISREQVAFLLSMFDDVPSADASAKYPIPCRHYVLSNLSVLGRFKTDATDFILATLNSPNSTARASGISVLSDYLFVKKNGLHPQLATEIARLSNDPSEEVRLAVARGIQQIPKTESAAMAAILTRLACEETDLIPKHAAVSLRYHAAGLTPHQAITLTERLSQNPTAVSSIAAAIVAACEVSDDDFRDAVFKAARPLLTSSDRTSRRAGISIVIHAAKGSSKVRLTHVADMVCQLIRKSDDIDEMAAIREITELQDELPAKSRAALIRELISIVESKKPSRKVRVSQAAVTRTHFVPMMNDYQTSLLVERLRKMLANKYQRLTALDVLAAVGPRAQSETDTLRDLCTVQDRMCQVAAAKALWKIDHAEKLCGQTFAEVMQSGADYDRRAAMAGLKEMGPKMLVVGDELVALMTHKRAYFLVRELLVELGPRAAVLAPAIKAIPDSEDERYLNTAQRVLAAIEAG